jgi:hypothetical protein
VAEFHAFRGLDETEAGLKLRSRHRLRSPRVAALGGGVIIAAALALAPQALADPAYTPGAPQLSTIADGASANAPWNEWQGDSQGFGLGTNPFTITNTGAGASMVNPTQVLPTYEPASGSTAYANVALDQGATNTDSDATIPYQSGEVGTPGPLAGYCGSGDFNTETGLGLSSQPSVSTQPTGATLPLGPDYFPHVVLNANGSLTGYFDYRPKDENEAVMAATSTDGGKTWTFDQEALQQDSGYCASADVNDDGQGHPNVLNFGGTTTAGDVTSGGTNDLFTLQRAGGDNEGVGMLVHNLTAAGATAGTPLGSLPSAQATGVDPDTFDTDGSAVMVPTTASTNTTSLTVEYTGTPGTIDDLVAGGFVDLGASGVASSSNAGAGDVIQCTGVTASTDPSDANLGTPSSPTTENYGTLTGCSASGSNPITVSPQDMLEQVIGYVSAQTPTSTNATSNDPQTKASAGSGDATFPITIPNGPGSEKADGGYAQIDVAPNTTDAAVTSANATDLGFTYELTGQTLNVNAPNRYYIDGTAVYCVQGNNNNPTQEIENCTVPVGTAALTTVAVGDPILADPIVPAGASMTTGLIAPDGIVGELHSFPTTNASTVPSGATYVMYDQKKVNYYVAGELNKDLCGIAEVTTESTSKQNSACPAATVSTATLPASLPYDITFNPWEYISEDFGSQLTVTPAAGTGTTDAGQNEGTFTLSGANVDFTMGDNTTGNYDTIQCTGVETVSTPEQPNANSASKTVDDTQSPVAAGVGSLQSGADDAFTGCEITAVTNVTGAAGGTTTSFGTNTFIAPTGAALAQPDQLQQTGEGKASSSASNADKLYSNNEDVSVLRAAWTTDGVNFYSDGLQNNGLISGSDASSIAGTTGSTGSCASDTSYTDLSNPNTACSPENSDGTVNLNKYSAAGTQLATEERWPGSGGSIIYNPTTGKDELFLSGAWAGDGDSDAFNSVYYATSTDGLNWTVPQTVVSTDYSFSASEEQDAALLGGTAQPVGISAYFSGRAYGPAVVPNPNGAGFWMIFAGYNVPKGAGTAGATLNPAGVTGTPGTDQYIGSGQTTGAAWSVGSGGNHDDPAMYRNILVDDIAADVAPTLTFTAPTGAVYGGSATLSATSNSTVSIAFAVDSTSGKGVCSISGTTLKYNAAGSCVIDVNEAAGDGYADAATTITKTITVAGAPLTITASSATMTQGGPVPIITPSYSGFVNHDTVASLSTQPTCFTQALSSSIPDNYSSICSAAADPNYVISYINGIVAVTASGVIVREASKTKLTASPATLTTKQKLRLSVDVTSDTATPRGTVKIYSGSKLLKTVTLSGAGKATATLSLKAGSYKLHAVYAGSADFKGSTSSIVKVKVKQAKKRK